ncbi:DNA repair protein RecO [Methylotenera sp.]|uniref:DNA repair protein RecO n=1 Tax=Methylotenera sp. TaxID=2051956 RepID=UPI002487A20E|nr:DNA repair protein RecO [Methylotenera sp.]MDI1297966.1 DNA repair protein RecO [Methylotenera sp.]
MAVSSNPHRQDNQPVYVLHTYPFKETSLVVELFAHGFGRVATTAKGARRPRSAMRGMLQSFQPLLATWSGKLELKTLHSLEWGGGLLLLKGEALMCGFYLNELLLRLLPREDPHESLFEYYSATLKILANGENLATTLRRFELKLLQELGYAIPLQHDVSSEQILEDTNYRYLAEHGATRLNGSLTRVNNGIQLLGKTLIDMASDDYSNIQTQQQSKQLMRYLLSHYLGDKPLHTRQLLIDLQGL